MTKEAVDVVLEGIVNLYSPPTGTNKPEEAIKEYRKALQGYLPEEYLAAWEKIRDTHARNTWPKIPEIKKILEEAKRSTAKADPKAREKVRIEEWKSKSVHEKLAATDRMMRGSLGKVAVNDGFPWSFWCHVWDHGTTPSGNEMDKMRLAAKETPKLVARLTQYQDRPLAEIGRKIIARNDHLKAHYDSGILEYPDLRSLGFIL